MTVAAIFDRSSWKIEGGDVAVVFYKFELGCFDLVLNRCVGNSIYLFFHTQNSLFISYETVVSRKAERRWTHEKGRYRCPVYL